VVLYSILSAVSSIPLLALAAVVALLWRRKCRGEVGRRGRRRLISHMRTRGRYLRRQADNESDGSDRSDGGAQERCPALLEIPTHVDVHGKVYLVQLQLGGVASWADVSERVHESCELFGIPELPDQGIMHLVLELDGRRVPVTPRTRFAALSRTSALRVTITTGEGVQPESVTETPAEHAIRMREANARAKAAKRLKKGRGGRSAYGRLPTAEDDEDAVAEGRREAV